MKLKLLATAGKLGVGLAAGTLACFLILPLVGLVAATGIGDFFAGLRDPLVWPALRLSLLTTSISLVVIVTLGTALAWWIAQHQGRIARLIETLAQLPIVIPPAVAGVAMLLAFGRRGLVGRLLPDGWAVAFTTLAVILAEVFVSSPYYVQAAVSAFRRSDADLVNVARSLGASRARVFWRVIVPLAAPALASGAALAWARALGEFGATLMFAGNLGGKTQTLPLAIYTAMESDVHAAQALSLVLIAVAFVVLVAVRRGARSWLSR